MIVFSSRLRWRDITNDKFFDRYPRWSPDGKRIAFTSDRTGRYEIWMLDADATVIAFVITANSAFGIVAGYLYWKYGLESAMLTHVLGHVVLAAATYAGAYF